MKIKYILFILLTFCCHYVLSQNHELVGLIDNKILKIDPKTGQTTLLLEINKLPVGTDLRDLVYQESKQEFYTIANPSENPYLAKISLTGEFEALVSFEAEFAKIYTVEAISLYNDEIYFSASLNGGINDNDFYSEALLKINKESELEFLTQINTEKPYPDIDVLNITDNGIFIFDGAPPNQNFLEFYKLDLNNLNTSSYPQNIYSASYIPLADFCFYESQLHFVAEKSLYTFNKSIRKVVEINTEEINSEGNFVGLTQFSSCPLPTANLENEILVCNEESITLDVEYPNSTYLWSDGSTNSTKTINESGIYKVEITNECGSKIFETVVTFASLPEKVKIASKATSCSSYILSFQTNRKGIKYQWKGGKEDSLLKVDKTDWYKWEISNACGSRTDSVFIEIKDFSNIILPNIITPNGDQKNDQFVIDERLQHAAISIFNRYGKLVHQNPQYLNDWNSGNLNSGNYFYLITLECGDVFTGWVEVRK